MGNAMRSGFPSHVFGFANAPGLVRERGGTRLYRAMGLISVHPIFRNHRQDQL